MRAASDRGYTVSLRTSVPRQKVTIIDREGSIGGGQGGAVAPPPN